MILGNRDTWYTGPQAKDKCWPAVAAQLVKDGWPEDPAIRSLDDSSTRVVSLLNHPKESFSTRGLVVGYVQSGKTTNFTAVMAKAADRGYKLFIVLAGIHNGLRRQTQAPPRSAAVGAEPAMWYELTGLEKDFTPPGEPGLYFASKSNRTMLLRGEEERRRPLRKLRPSGSRRLDEYLGGLPALIIDDEADQSTVATTTINPLIYEIMSHLPRVGYVGYTASPFANLLIDPGDERTCTQGLRRQPAPACRALRHRSPVRPRALDGEDP